MNGELWKLKEEKRQPFFNKTLVFALVSIFAMLVMCGVIYSVRTRAKPAAKPASVFDPTKPVGLRIFEGKTTFAVDPIQTIDLRLPCSGLLTISLTFPKGTTLSAFLLTAEGREKMKARENVAHVEGFDAKTSSGTYQQAAELSPGRYSLVLLDEGKSRSVVEVKAQLSDLK